MKRYYGVQLLIDVVLITLGFIIYLFPKVSMLNSNIVFYTMMSIYAGLELIEYFSREVSKESLCLFFSSAVCAFSGFFLRSYDSTLVLSITLLTFTVLVVIVKIISLERVYGSHDNLFLVKISTLSAFTLIGLLISTNIYFKISVICYMLALFYTSYGVLELIGDILDYITVNNYVLEE